MWYVAYGSNMDRRRLTAYLGGGGVSGSRFVERGARDPRAPLASARLWLDRRVRFVGHSRRWGGGVAVLEHRRRTGVRTPARAWLIGHDQFEDIVAQENRRPVAPIRLPGRTGRVVAVGTGTYDGLLLLGHSPVDGRPLVTITAPEPPEQLPSTPPSAAYAATIAAGITETHGPDAVPHTLGTPDPHTLGTPD